MQMKSFMPFNPLFDLGMLVGGIIIHDQMQFHPIGSIPVHLPQKL